MFALIVRWSDLSQPQFAAYILCFGIKALWFGPNIHNSFATANVKTSSTVDCTNTFHCYLQLYRHLCIFFLIINQLDALISQIYSWKETLHVSDSSSVRHQEFFTVHTAIGICHTSLLTAWEQDQDGTCHPDPALKLSANLYDIYHCCVYSEKLLMTDRRTVRNM